MSTGNSILITRLFLKVDFRNKDDAGFRRLIGIIITYLFANALITNNNFLRLDKPSFVFAALSVNFFFVAFIIVTDYAQLFFAKQQTEILKTLPVKQGDIFSAKIISSFIYLSIFPLTVSVPPSVFIYFYNNLIFDSIIFFISSVVFSYFIIAVILLVNSIVMLAAKGKSKIMIYVFQILFFIFIFSINSYSGKLSHSTNILGSAYAKYLPQYYFAMSLDNIYFLLSSIAVTLLLFALTYFYLRNKYYALSEIAGSMDTHKESIFGKLRLNFSLKGIENLLLHNNSEKASYQLIKNLFANTTVLKLRLFPVFLIPLISTLVGVISGIPGMLVMMDNNKVMDSNILVISPAITMTTLMCIRLLYSNTKMSFETDGDINWLYKYLPVERRKFSNGIIKFIYVYFLFPSVLITTLLLLIRLPLADVLINQLYLVSFGIFINSFLNRFDKTFPFSIENTKFNTSSKYLDILYVILFGIVFIVSQIFIFKSIIFVLIAVPVLAVISYLLNK
jgi:ABC-2 type transport system permease protein